MAKGYKITETGDVIDKLFTYRDTYNEKGKYLGFETLHEHYSMSLGNCTDWTGYPMSGKTQVLMELLINTSMFYGWKHLIYFPDVGTNVEIIADLIHKKTGKSFNPSNNNVITNEEITRNIDWVIQHFKVLTKSDVKAKMTPIEFWDMAVELQKHGELHTASIDSWKDLTHEYEKHGGYAQYLEYVLPYRNQIAEDNNLHLHTIIHPKLTEKVNGKRAVPVPYDLKGGSEWFNSGKCMITVHRQDPTHNLAEIHFNKIKPRSNGKVGSIELWFDKERLTYFEQINPAPNVYEKIYASPRNEKIIETNYHNAIKQNDNFDDGLPF